MQLPTIHELRLLALFAQCCNDFKKSKNPTTRRRSRSRMILPLSRTPFAAGRQYPPRQHRPADPASARGISGVAAAKTPGSCHTPSTAGPSLNEENSNANAVQTNRMLFAGRLRQCYLPICKCEPLGKCERQPEAATSSRSSPQREKANEFIVTTLSAVHVTNAANKRKT